MRTDVFVFSVLPSLLLLLAVPFQSTTPDQKEEKLFFISIVFHFYELFLDYYFSDFIILFSILNDVYFTEKAVNGINICFILVFCSTHWRGNEEFEHCNLWRLTFIKFNTFLPLLRLSYLTFTSKHIHHRHHPWNKMELTLQKETTK